jgi:raffinose/stachyose/melibiose transport system substrate-binding protein
LSFDFVNLPAMPGAGNQDSVIGVVTGHVINEKSTKKELAAEFLALLNNAENVEAFIAAEAVPLAIPAASSDAVDERTARLGELLASGGTVISPPDTGYDLKVAEAFYSAVASVLGAQSSPGDAVATLAAAVK